jgi:hypothetical protein
VFSLRAAEKLNGWSGNNSSKSGSNVKIITEETADILTSYVNAIRFDVSVGRMNNQNKADAMSSVPELNSIARFQLNQLNSRVSLAQYRYGQLDDM